MSLFLLFYSCKKDALNNNTSIGTSTLVVDNDSNLQHFINGKKFQLAWSDEFNEKSLDTALWNYRYGERISSNNLSKNIIVEDGLLKIKLIKEKSFIENENGVSSTPSQLQFTSGGVISKSLFDTGYYECSVKFPSANNWHTSFWTIQYYTVKNNEIDIEENTSDSEINQTYHCGTIDWNPYYDPLGLTLFGYNVKGDKFPTLDKSFNLYGCLVTSDSIKYYFNNIEVVGYKISKTWSSMQIKPANILLTSVGLTGCSIMPNLDYDEADFDYVRYYKE
ncbi:MAG: family 16 glycosylhydrolase [Arachidicoccus sp.]|nr:family 16 glycosylhydrolase [Arachidicoccus sp.]